MCSCLELILQTFGGQSYLNHGTVKNRSLLQTIRPALNLQNTITPSLTYYAVNHVVLTTFKPHRRFEKIDKISSRCFTSS